MGAARGHMWELKKTIGNLYRPFVGTMVSRAGAKSEMEE
jgi:hypothetical protein